MQTKIAIIGAGLAGLTLAEKLHAAGVQCDVFEARERLGGRVYTANAGGAPLDLGPSWFWPGQHRLEALFKRLGLARFEQMSKGHNVFEDERGAVQKLVGFASMQNSWRATGGSIAIADALAAQLPEGRVHRGKALTSVSQEGLLQFADGSECTAETIVLTMPPRVMAELSFTPELPAQALSAMRAIPTWMAGHAKFFATYERPFWRDAGLSGDAFSRRGPLAEVHDASPGEEGKPGALFGFLGIDARQRAGQDAAVKKAAIAQLARMFGPEAANPLEVHYKDWASDPFTATSADLRPLGHHPSYIMPRALTDLWNGKLIVCGTETAPDTGGFMEGALAAAEKTAAQLLDA